MEYKVIHTIWKVLQHIYLCHRFVEKFVCVIIAASFQQRFRRSLYSFLMCLSDVSLWYVSLMCLSDISLWYVSLMCLSDVYLWCVSLICLSDMSLWWRLFQTCVVLTILDIYVLITSFNLVCFNFYISMSDLHIEMQNMRILFTRNYFFSSICHVFYE